MRIRTLTLAMLLSSAVYAELGAESAADKLLGAVPDTAPAQLGKTVVPNGVNPKAALAIQASNMKLTDPFLIQFFTLWQQEGNLSYEVNQWAIKFLQNDFEGTAHLWGSVKNEVPASFRETALAAQIYSLWKVNVPQTAFNLWMEALGQKRFTESRAASALEQTLQVGFDEWLYDNAITVSGEQEAIIKSLDPTKSLSYATMHGWLALRSGANANKILARLPRGNWLKIPLAQTVVLDASKRAKLAEAGRAMKQYWEPELEKKNDPRAYASYYLQLGRLLYQAGALEEARQFYEKVPTGAPEYLRSREELLWIWLRTGKMDRLRGELKSLSLGVYDEKFNPDVYVVFGISNLKLCFYDEVEKDIKEFVKTNGQWAKRIQMALASPDPEKPLDIDFFSALAERAIEERAKEVEQVAVYEKKSLAASLPAVGVQTHWTTAREKMMAAIDRLKKKRAEEYHRQWRNYEAVLLDSIRKMQFVKVEFLSQVRNFSKTEALPDGAKVAAAPAQELTDAKAPGMQSFPFDGVVWPDELFHLRGLAQAKCLKGVGNK